MGLFDNLHERAFGGGQQGSRTQIDKNQLPFLTDLWGQAQGVAQGIGTAQGEQGMADAAMLQNAGLGLTGSLAGAGSQMQPFTALSNPGGGLSPFTQTSGAGRALAPFMTGGFIQPQLDVLGQQLGQQFSTGLNEIQNRFGLSGTIGSRAGVTGGQLLEGLGRNMALGTSSILNSDLTRRQNAANAFEGFRLQDLSRAGGAAQAQGALNLADLSRAGSAASTMGQQGLLGHTTALGALPGLFDLGQAGYNSQFSTLGNYANLVGQPTQTGSSFGYNKAGFFGSGAADSIATFAALSDRRLKRDVEYLGQHKGVKWYVYRYLWSPVQHVGVMAQEMLDIRPEAVIQHPDGYLMVDYAKVPV